MVPLLSCLGITVCRTISSAASCLFAVLIGLSWVGTNKARGQALHGQEMQQTLQMLIETNKTMADSITTWQGAIQVEDELLFDKDKAAQVFTFRAPGDAVSAEPSNVGLRNPVLRRSTGLVTFGLDSEGKRLFSSYQGQPFSLVYADTKEPVRSAVVGRFQQISILTPEYYLHFQPNVRYATPREDAHGSRRMAFRSERHRGDGQQWGIIVDPRIFVEYAGKSIGKVMEQVLPYHKDGQLEANGGKLEVIRIQGRDKEGYLVSVAMPMGDRLPVQQILFEKSAGFNPTRLVIRAPDGRVHQVINWKYKQQGDVFVPHELTYRQIAEDGQKIRFTRKARLIKSVINEPLPEGIFTDQNIGVEDEDWLCDEISGEVFEYLNGTFDPIGITAGETIRLIMANESAKSVVETTCGPDKSPAAEHRTTQVLRADRKDRADAEPSSGLGNLGFPRLAIGLLGAMALLALVYYVARKRTRSSQGHN